MATKRASSAEPASTKKAKGPETEVGHMENPEGLGTGVLASSWPGSPINLPAEVIAMFSRDQKPKSPPEHALNLKVPPSDMLVENRNEDDVLSSTEVKPEEKLMESDKPHILNNNSYDGGIMTLAYPCQKCSYFTDKLDELTRHYQVEHHDDADSKLSITMPSLFGSEESATEDLNSSEASIDPRPPLHEGVIMSSHLNTASSQLILPVAAEEKPDIYSVDRNTSPVENKDIMLSISAAVEEPTSLDLTMPHKTTADPNDAENGTSSILVTSRPPDVHEQSVADLLKEASSASSLMAQSVTKMAALVSADRQAVVANSMASESTEKLFPAFTSHSSDNTSQVLTVSRSVPSSQAEVHASNGHPMPPPINVTQNPLKPIANVSPLGQYEESDSVMKDLDLDPDVYYMCRVCQRFLVPQRERLWEHVMESHFPGTRAAPSDREEETKTLGKALRRWFVSEDGSKYSATIADVAIFWHVRHQCKLCPYQTPARLGIITHVYSHIKDSVIYVCKYCGDQQTEINESLTHHSNAHAGNTLAIQQCFIKTEDQYVVFPVKEKGKPKIQPPLTPQQIREDLMKRLIEKIKPEAEANHQEMPVDAPGTLPVLTAAVLSQSIHANAVSIPTAPSVSPPAPRTNPSPPVIIPNSIQIQMQESAAQREQLQLPKPKPRKKPSKPKNPRAPPAPRMVSQFAKPGSASLQAQQKTVSMEEEPDLFVVDPEVVFLCRACCFYSSSKVIIREHVRAHNKSFSCGICKTFNAASRNLLALHYGMTHQGEVVQCKVFANELELKMLYMKEETSKHLKFLSKASGDGKGNGPYRCHMCEYYATEDELIRSHVHLHHDAPSPYLCSICSFLCATESDIKEHMKGIHPTSDQTFRWNQNLMTEMELYFEHVPPGSSPEATLRTVPHELIQVLTRPTPEQPMSHAFTETVQQRRKSYYPKEHFKYLIDCALCLSPLKDFPEAEVHLSTSHTIASPYICKMCGPDAQSYAKKCHMLTHMRKRHSLDPYGVYELCKTQTDLMTPYLVVKTSEGHQPETVSQTVQSTTRQPPTSSSSQDQWNDSQDALEAHVRSLQDIAEAMMAHVETSNHSVQDEQEMGMQCQTSGLLEEAVKQAELPMGDGKDNYESHGLTLGSSNQVIANLSLNNHASSAISASSVLAQVAQEHGHAPPGGTTPLIPHPLHIVRTKSHKPGKFRCAYCVFSSNDSTQVVAHVRSEHSTEPQVYITS